MEQENDSQEQSVENQSEITKTSLWRKFWWVPTLLLVLITGAVTYAQVRNAQEVPGDTATPAPTQSSSPEVVQSPSTGATTLASSELLWGQTEGGWKAMGTVPTCDDPMKVQPPVDLSKASSVLYPGQTRGQYKPHGGLRFDSISSNVMDVKAPFDGYFVRGARYIESGEVQYLIDIMSNCGVMSRFDHIRTVPASIESLMKSWPEPLESDTRTQSVNPPYSLKAGDVVGTAIGFNTTKNYGMDWGLYDFRKENAASQNPSYRANHASMSELSYHAVCWFDWLPDQSRDLVRSLPAGDQKSGKSSDYCS